MQNKLYRLMHLYNVQTHTHTEEIYKILNQSAGFPCMRRKSSALYRKRKHEPEYENMLNILLSGNLWHVEQVCAAVKDAIFHLSSLQCACVGRDWIWKSAAKSGEKGGFIVSSNVDIKWEEGGGHFDKIYIFAYIYAVHQNKKFATKHVYKNNHDNVKKSC